MILGLFPKREDADEALFHLTDNGFKTDEISVIANEERLAKYRSKKSGGDGALTGGLLGGLTGLLIAATPVVLPGVGILVAGPLTALTGLAMGAITGGLFGALIDLGVSEKQARSYEKRIKKGGVLLTVPVSEKTEDKARQIMKAHNAEELTIIRASKETEAFHQQPSSQSYQSAGLKGGKVSKRN